MGLSGRVRRQVAWVAVGAALAVASPAAAASPPRAAPAPPAGPQLLSPEPGARLTAASELRALEIVPRPFVLTVGARARQRLRRPAPGNRSNNLVLRLRCNRACRVRLRGNPSFRAGGGWRALRGLAVSTRLGLPGGRRRAYGFRFSAAERSRLVAAMREHGPLRWRFAVRATAADGAARRATRVIRMTPPPRPAPVPAPPESPSRPACDPSYPGVCIPPPPPDLDCGDIPYRDFAVVGSDPHGFDGDGDGVGCES